MLLRWPLPLLGLVLAHCAKQVQRSGAADMEQLLADYARADRRAVEHDLLDYRDGPQIQEVLGTLQAVGISPNKLEAWLGGTGSNPLTAASENFQAMLSSLRSADRNGTKQAFRDIAALGQESVKHSFAALNTLGYDPGAVHSWLFHENLPTPRARTRPEEEPSVVIHHLENLLNKADPKGVKDVLHAIERKGGKDRVTHAFARLENLGYLEETVKQWMEKLGPSTKIVPEEMPSVVAEHDAHDLEQFLQESNKVSMKKKLARMLMEGGEQRLSDGLEQLHQLGYDIAAVKSWYISGGDGAPPKPERRSASPQLHFALSKSNESGGGAKAVDSSGALDKARAEHDAHLLRLIYLTADGKDLLTALNMLRSGGDNARIDAAFKNLLQKFAIKKEDVERKAFASLDKKQGENATSNITSGVTNENQFDAPKQVGELNQSNLVTPGDVKGTAALSSENVEQPANRSIESVQHNVSQPSSKAAEQQQQQQQQQQLLDGQHLEMYIKKQDREGMHTVMQNIFKAGGADKVAEAFGILESMKYDSEELQRWITQGGAAPVKIISKSDLQSDRSPVSDASNTLVSSQHSTKESSDFSEPVSTHGIKDILPSSNSLEESNAEGDATQIDVRTLDKYLKEGYLPSAKRLLKDMFNHGGLPRIESALGGLQALGYDPIRVQTLLEGDVSSPIKAVRKAEDEGQFSKQSSEGKDTSSQATTRARIDAQLLEVYLLGNDMAGMKETLARLNSEGGQERVQAALRGLQVFGHNPGSLEHSFASAEALKRSDEEESAEASSENTHKPLAHGLEHSMKEESETQPREHEDVDAALSPPQNVDAALTELIEKAQASNSVAHTALRAASSKAHA